MPIIEKITKRMNHWSCKHLSYAGWVTLIQSIFLGMKAYWSQVFILPTKVVRKIEMLCRSFLWKGMEKGVKKGYISWASITQPVSCGGLGIRDFLVWNKTALMKQVWALAEEKHRL